MNEPTVVEWDAARLPPDVLALLPAELRALAPGRYLVEPLVDDEELTPEEEDGLLRAMRAIEAGEGIPWEQVRAELSSRISE